MMKKSNTIFFLILILLISVGTTCRGQDDDTTKNNYYAKDVLDSSLTRQKAEWQFEFKDVNRTYPFKVPGIKEKVHKPLYVNEKQLQNIEKLMIMEDKAKLVPALEDYIRNFSVMNFHQNTDLIWKLAQLHESMGNRTKALFFYRLALKHHDKTRMEEIQQYFTYREDYDIKTELERDYFVPLKEYYELVEFRKAVDTLIPPKSVLLNMGTDINEKKVADYGPTLGANDGILIFTKRTVDNATVNYTNTAHGKIPVNEDLYFVRGQGENYWGRFEKFDVPINSKCNEGSACLSKDGKTLFFSRCKTKFGMYDCRECMGSCDLYVAYLQDDSTWTHPKNMGENINSVYWDSHPTLSKTEDTLFYASHRPDGFGLSDIYFTVKEKDGSWSKGKNLGPIINTRYNEDSPYIHPKYNVLYFASSGHLLNFDDIDKSNPIPSLDLYKSYLINGKWQEPKNLGPLVNGKGDESYFTIDSKSRFLYYAKTEKGMEKKDKHKTDLFSFPLPMEAQPLATITLNGLLTDEETGDPLEAIVSIIDVKDGIEVAPKNVRKDGTFNFELINNKDYLLVIQGNDFFRIEKLFHLDGDTTIESKAKKIDKNKKLEFTSLEFENGKADILDAMKEDLKKVVDFMLDNPKYDVTISGHTDGDGNPDFNKKLSQKRADAIRTYILEEGVVIDPTRITAIGYGSEKPIKKPEVTDEDKAINRRVEFEIKYDESNFTDDDFSGDSGDDQPVDDGPPGGWD